ncbi:copper resistance CopC family protein [uncultured Arthrobacter sp.]|uniref:copper resistance CopC family protein n=1 Tax=uncultured Arthrobacter sp. TaxID=114050 RepID=UPI00321773F5
MQGVQPRPNTIPSTGAPAAPARGLRGYDAFTPGTNFDPATLDLSLTLSDAPLKSAQLNTSILKVTDSTGKTLSDDNVQVNGATLSTAITAGQPGPYTVQWRAVSSDGHPIEGTYTFTVRSSASTATPSQPAATAVPSASAAPAVTSGDLGAPAR